MSLPRVKICGITNPDDAEAAIEAGADALGFNGYAGSKRYIDLREASCWIAQLPPFITRVAVLVNPSWEEAAEILALPGIDAVQLHGDETPEFCSAFRQQGGEKGFIKALAARNRESLRALAAYGTRSILLDAYVPGEYGGTGSLIDLELAAAVVRENPQLSITLSGGLTPGNIAGAVAAVRPYAVDVASGVESHSRKKESSLMRDFVAAAKGGG